MPTVLIVDDEPLARALMRRILEQDGFQVVTAEDGHDAVRVSASHKGRFDLLISDVVMPGMDGATLASQLLSSEPELPVLLVSGYCENLPLHRGRPFRLLNKPFSADALVSTVRNLLGGARSPRLTPAPDNQ